MSSSSHKERVRRAYEDLNQGNPATLLELLDPDVTYTLIGTTALSQTLRGRDAVVQKLFTPLVASLATPLTFDIQSVIADADQVALQGLGHATMRSGA